MGRKDELTSPIWKNLSLLPPFFEPINKMENIMQNIITNLDISNITTKPAIPLPKNTPTLPNKKYSIIYADPPWSYGNTQFNPATTKPTSSADIHYPTMNLEQIKEIDIPAICENDCLLYMWSSSPHLHQAIALGDHWKFEYKTIGFCWEKEITNPGFYTMSSVEVCLIFKKGKIPSPRGSRNIRQFLSQKRTKHSKKPDIIRDRIVEMFPTQRKIELFAREKFDGWDSYGNEV